MFVFQQPNNQRGFTLIEIVVVLGLFSVFSVIVADIFLSSVKTQQKIIWRQRLLAEARYATELISRYTRMGTVAYSDYSSGSVVGIPESNNEGLRIRDLDNKKVWFKQDTLNCPVGVTNCLVMSIDQGVNWYSITSNIEVVDLNFYITPLDDPFTGGGPDQQPAVSAALHLQSKASFSPPLNVYAQTMTSTRIYDR